MPKQPVHILVLDDEESIRWVIRQTFKDSGYTFHFAESGKSAQRIIDRHAIDFALVDIHLPDTNGLVFLRQQLAAHSGMLIAVITGDGSMGHAVEAMKLGAFDYLTKPFDLDEVEALVARAVQSVTAARQNPPQPLANEPSLRAADIIIGKSRSIREIYKSVGRVADSGLTVLILGESGTGKELIARSLHIHSAQADEPFVAVNCAAIPKDLLEAELFGYEKGAFTGAVERKAGRLESAGKGTILLDEIGELSLELQAKLLRVLQEREFQRVGGLEALHLDARILAATNQSLMTAVQEGRFRNDLYYRISPFVITADALRDRPEDVPALVSHFLAKNTKKLGLAAKSMTPEAMERLIAYDWPGNVRELENVIKSLMILTTSAVIGEADLPRNIAGTPATPDRGKSFEESVLRHWNPMIAQYCESNQSGLLQELLSHLERPLIRDVLERTRWNQVRTSKILGINRNTLRTRMQTLGIRKNPQSQNNP